MAGTLDGGRKAAETNKQRYGEDFYRTIGRSGGHTSTGGGFASMPREKVQAAGRKGGQAPRKPKEKKSGWVTWLTNGD